jgi:hypothetical protein
MLVSAGKYVEAFWRGFLPSFSGLTYFKKDLNYLNPVDGGMKLFQNVSSTSQEINLQSSHITYVKSF